MSLQPLSSVRKQELEDEAGPHGAELAEALGERAQEAVEGFPASTEESRSAICLLAADSLIHAAAKELGVAVNELPGRH